jgi:hypothetical protein
MVEEGSLTLTRTLQLEPVTTPGFTCTPSLSEHRLSLVFDGTGDVAAIEPLSSLLKHVHTEAQRLSLTEVSCDFRQLTFMNSSCFKSFVVWIDTVKNSTEPYKIRFTTGASMPWQRRSLEALRRLATNVVSVEA